MYVAITEHKILEVHFNIYLKPVLQLVITQTLRSFSIGGVHDVQGLH